jgi:hypothetical protein
VVVSDPDEVTVRAAEPDDGMRVEGDTWREVTLWPGTSRVKGRSGKWYVGIEMATRTDRGSAPKFANSKVDVAAEAVGEAAKSAVFIEPGEPPTMTAPGAGEVHDSVAATTTLPLVATSERATEDELTTRVPMSIVPRPCGGTTTPWKSSGTRRPVDVSAETLTAAGSAATLRMETIVVVPTVVDSPDAVQRRPPAARHGTGSWSFASPSTVATSPPPPATILTP